MQLRSAVATSPVGLQPESQRAPSARGTADRLARLVRASWFWPVAVAAGYVGQVVFRLALVTGQNYPTVGPDEHMYLVLARLLAGGSATEIPSDMVIPGGYPLLISPALRITHDPVHAYHLVLGINALLSCLVLPLAYVALRKLDVPRPVSYVLATVVVMLPPVVFYSQFALADTPLPALVLAWLIGVHGLLSEGPFRRRCGSGILAGSAAGFSMMVHDRGGVVVALTCLVLLVAFARNWAPRPATAATLSALALMYATQRELDRWLLSRLDGTHPSQVGNAVWQTLRTPELYQRTVMRWIGHTWYFVTSTWGMGALGLVVCCACLAGTKAPRADRVVAFLTVALLLGVSLAAAAALPTDRRIDTIVNARYLSPLVPALFLAGTVALHRIKGRRALVRATVAAIALTVALTAALTVLAGDRFHKLNFILWALPDTTFLSSRWSGDWGVFSVPLTTATALTVFTATVLLRGLLSIRRPAVAMIAVGMALTLFAGWATVTIAQHVSRPTAAHGYPDATGFMEQARIRPGDRLVMDLGLGWRTRFTMAYMVLDGRVWTRDLTGPDTPPDGANVAVTTVRTASAPATDSWPKAPSGWHVAVVIPQRDLVIWRRDG
ncbi:MULTISPECIES: phospholipid carrier-dependent glycosyltransferase [Streptomyces]|uniref:phospholipid carrier-dependent glycosyltransferase n=1 Tax=Streptomyces TaxID=1883 RepID=UPI0018DFCE0C|nr:MULTISPECIES: phospholipid carrier-dependent glycosyltransferase [Streptomyces]MCZ4095362.1 phospholipid carrier-dependent glycosyltransferase [Streptomyces sp. H39-C1]